MNFWLYFWPGVENVENDASGIDFGHASAEECNTSAQESKTFGHTSAQGSITSKIHFGHTSAEGSKTLKNMLVGPKRRKSCFYDRFWPYFRPGVQNVENHVSRIPPPRGPKEDNRASGIDFWLYFWPGVQMIENRASGIDFGNASAEECKTSGPKRRQFLREIDFGHASSCSWQGPYFRPGVQNVLTGWCVGVG